MKKLRKLAIYKVAKINTRYVVGVLAVVLPTTAYLYSSTDILRCRDCAYRGDGVIIRNDELESKLTASKTFYTYNKQDVDSEVLKEDTLNQLIRDKKVSSYAESKKISVSDDELNKLYNDRVNQNGSEEKLLKKIKDYYGYDKEQYTQVLKMDILREKVQQSIGTPLSEWY